MDGSSNVPKTRAAKPPPSPYAGVTDPASLLLVEIIMRAIDDFGYAQRLKQRNAAHPRAAKHARRAARDAEDARLFLFSPYGYRLERLLKVAKIPPELVSLKRVRSLAMAGCHGTRPAIESFVALCRKEPEAPKAEGGET